MLLFNQLGQKQGGGGELPSEYQEVAWLYSNGHQYVIIDGMYGDVQEPEYIDFTIQADAQSVSANYIFGGSYGVSKKNGYCFGFVSGSTTNISICHYQGSPRASLLSVDGEQHRFIVDMPAITENNRWKSFNIYVDGTPISAYLGNVSSVASDLQKISIFNTYYNNVAYTAKYVGKFIGRIYRKVGNKEQLLVPCYEKSSSSAGYYDVKNGVFYGNVGSGSFIVGADV